MAPVNSSDGSQTVKSRELETLSWNHWGTITIDIYDGREVCARVDLDLFGDMDRCWSMVLSIFSKSITTIDLIPILGQYAHYSWLNALPVFKRVKVAVISPTPLDFVWVYESAAYYIVQSEGINR